MKIYRPIFTNYKGQGFGENIPCCRLNEDGNPILPYQIVVPPYPYTTCLPGTTKFYPAMGLKGHNGEDWTARKGEPVYFAGSADCEWEAATEVDSGGGIGVRVRAKTPILIDELPAQAGAMTKTQWQNWGKRLKPIFLFWHLERVNVYDKQPVKTGDLIGYADSTGASSGDHLHYAMKFSDENSWFTIDGDNGYNGAMDFSRWFENKFILDVQGPPPIQHFNFVVNLSYGKKSVDILNLQKALQIDGSFPSNVPPTGYYGDITAASILKFRIKYGVSSTTDPLGRSCGPLTRAKLNQLFN